MVRSHSENRIFDTLMKKIAIKNALKSKPHPMRRPSVRLCRDTLICQGLCGYLGLEGAVV
jgi:hypothetical protein